jgi:hypothetical protein
MDDNFLLEGLSEGQAELFPTGSIQDALARMPSPDAPAAAAAQAPGDDAQGVDIDFEDLANMLPSPVFAQPNVTPGRKQGDQPKAKWTQRAQFDGLSRDDLLMIHKQFKKVITDTNNKSTIKAYNKIRRTVSDGVWNKNTYETFLNLLLGQDNTDIPDDLQPKLASIRALIQKNKVQLTNEINANLNKDVYNEIYSKCFIYRLKKIESGGRSRDFGMNEIDKVYTGRPGDAPIKFISILFNQHRTIFKNTIMPSLDNISADTDDNGLTFSVVMYIQRMFSGGNNPARVRYPKGNRLENCEFKYRVTAKVRWDEDRGDDGKAVLDYNSLRGQGVVKSMINKAGKGPRQACQRYKIDPELVKACVPRKGRKRRKFVNQAAVKRVIKKDNDDSRVTYRFKENLLTPNERRKRRRARRERRRIARLPQRLDVQDQRVRHRAENRMLIRVQNDVLNCSMLIYEENNFYLAKSRIPNVPIGLFAQNNLNSGTKLEYIGKRLKPGEEVNIQNRDYLMTNLDNDNKFTIDGNPELACQNREGRMTPVSMAVFANEPPPQSDGANAEFIEEGDKIYIELNKRVKANDEIYVCYSNEYGDRDYPVHPDCGGEADAGAAPSPQQQAQGLDALAVLWSMSSDDVLGSRGSNDAIDIGSRVGGLTGSQSVGEAAGRFIENPTSENREELRNSAFAFLEGNELRLSDMGNDEWFF